MGGNVMPFEPTVSIVIVNLNGLRHLDECFKSIQRLDYPKEKIEVVMVDNGSTDGSVEFMRKKYSWVKLIRNSKNEGFAKPSDDGARAATGEYVAFLNNDMKVQKRWLAELVHSIEVNQATCAGSVILNWNGELLDFAGGSVSFYGMGYQHHFHEAMKTVEPLLTQDKELLFACGGAMLMRRDVFLQIGGFDEDFFAYFEDVDLGWRMRVLGHKVVLSVASRVYHTHHRTGIRFAQERMWLLYQRNSLYTIYKNYSEEMLGKTFWPTVLMNQAILFDSMKVDRDEYDLRLTHEDFHTSGVQLSHQSVAELSATYDFIRNLKKMTAKRQFIQGNRKTPDAEILPFIQDPFICMGKTGSAYHRYIYDFAKTFQIDQAFHTNLKRKVLLISSGCIGKKMLGPAIRYFEFAKCLSASFDVSLASAGQTDITEDAFELFDYTNQEAKLVQYAEQADIILLQGFILEDYVNFARVAKTKYLIVDLYDPYVIENLEVLKDHDPSERRANHRFSSQTLQHQLSVGDLFLAANQKQQDYWMGMLSSLGRVTPKVYDLTNNLDKMINTVPFGISDDAPVHTHKVLKGVWPGIEEDDFLLVWGGGVWNWFDPLTLIRAIGIVSQSRKNIKLFFMGVKHPNPALPEMKMLYQAVELAKELNLYDKYVFFNYDWVEYHDRQNYLLEADVGVSCHFDTMETRFSFRTRIL
ncbi:MAG: glycosyltransferase, partial [Ethanoligenens sp.]